jgi:3-oxoacyl-[acyl-carrier protein] reductase
MKYDGKQVVITGATRGLGRMLATYFQSEGANVVGLSRSEGCDVGNLDDVRRCMPRKVDILICNAGVSKAGYAMMLSPKDVQDVVQTNLIGAFFASREAAKSMRSAGRGRIVNISSIAVPFEDPGTSLYAATKAAVLTMQAVLSKEFAPMGITVNALGLSALPTEMFGEHSPETQAKILSRLIPPRVATFQEVAHVLDFFLADEADNVTNQCVWLGGAR